MQLFTPGEKNYSLIPDEQLHDTLTNDLTGGYPNAGLKFLKDYVKENGTLVHPVLGNINEFADAVDAVWAVKGGYGNSFFAVLIRNIKVPQAISEPGHDEPMLLQ